jgi:hypothetical protein
MSPLTSILTLTLLMAGSSAQAEPHAVQDLGEFHGGETIARDGETWLALVEEDQTLSLRSVQVQVRPVNDPVLDAEGETSGREVSVPALSSAPVLLLRGPALTEGTISATAPRYVGPQIGSAIEIAEPDGETLYLGLSCNSLNLAPQDSQPGVFRCDVRLRGRGREQVLHSLDARMDPDAGLVLGSDGSVMLRFAGDLDGDGRSDLVLDVSEHYNGMRTVLWLSSGATLPALLHEVAATNVTGC